MAQCTWGQVGKQNGGRGGVAEANAILTGSGTTAAEGVTTAAEGEEIVMVLIPIRMLYTGATGKPATTSRRLC